MDTVINWCSRFLLCVGTVFVAFMIFRLYYGMYADEQCLRQGYRTSKTTFSGDIYCQYPYRANEIKRLEQ